MARKIISGKRGGGGGGGGGGARGHRSTTLRMFLLMAQCGNDMQGKAGRSSSQPTRAGQGDDVLRRGSCSKATISLQRFTLAGYTWVLCTRRDTVLCSRARFLDLASDSSHHLGRRAKTPTPAPAKATTVSCFVFSMLPAHGLVSPYDQSYIRT